MKPPKRTTDSLPSESTPATGNRRDRGLLATLERICLLACIYLFSIGPMYWTWVQAKFLNGNYLIAVLYEPLWILAGLVPPLGHWLNWYVRWWNL